MLERLKTALRITTTAFDGELLGLIDAAKADLIRYGIKPEIFLLTPLPADVEVAIIAYAKSRFGSNAEADRWELIYAGEKAQLGIHEEYRA